MQNLKWWPLRAALAWIVSRDEKFTREMSEQTYENSNWILWDQLETAMMREGCFTEQIRETLVGRKGVVGRKRFKLKEHSLVSGYQGRFQLPAEEYEETKHKRLRDGDDDDATPLSVHNFILDSLCGAASKLAHLAGQEKIAMRDEKDTISPAQAKTLGIIGGDGGLLPDGQMVDASGLVRAHVDVNREQLLEHFPAVQTRSAEPESLCRAWLEEEMRKSPHRSPKPRDHFLTEALQKFPGLSKRGFGKAWNAANTATGAKWKRAGRPSKKSSH
jgi:hypothetical protein